MPQILPTFRTDMEIIPQFVGKKGLRYFLKDPETQEIFELGEAEYFLCQKLDGKTTLDSVQLTFQEQFTIPLSLDQLEAFVYHLGNLGLLASDGELSCISSYDSDQIKMRRLGNPDRLFNLLAKHLRWCFSKPFLVGFFLFFILAVGIAFKFAGDFIYEVQLLLASGLYLMVPVLGIFVINVLAEIAKGVSLKLCGQSVPDFSVYFILKIIPRFHCDISNVSWLPKKSDRIRVFSAGLIFQLLLWGIAVFGWENTFPWTKPHIFWLFFSIAATIYFFVNFIPFFQRDGYYLLSTWLEIPDLRTRAKNLTKSWILRRPLPEPLSSREIQIFKRYGLLCIGFDFIFWSLLLGLVGYLLCSHLKGPGALIFIIVLCFRFENVWKRLCPRIFRHPPLIMNQSGGILIRRLFQLGFLVVLIIVAFIPYPFTVGGEFRLVPIRQLGIRSQVEAEIERVLVKEGQHVKAGEPVAVLLGRDQKKKIEAIKALLDEAQARLDLLKKGPKPEEIAKSEQEVITAKQKTKYSKIEAKRAEKLVKEKALSEIDYMLALRQRDLEKELLKLAQKNLELVKSGAREEEIKEVAAEIRRLEVELKHAEEDLELTTLISPADGRIITPYLSEKIGHLLRVGDLFAVVEDARTIIAEIEVPEEDVTEVQIGRTVKLKTWAHLNRSFHGKVMSIAPVAYEKSRKRVERTLTETELIIEQNEIIREQGKVVRVLSELSNADGLLKTDMTGYAKIECEKKPVGIAFTRWLVRFITVEVWSWIP